MKRIFVLFLVIACLPGGWSCSPRQSGGQEGSVATIRVASIVCGECVKTVETAIKGVEGVEEVKVSLENKTATVKYLPAKTGIDAIEAVIVNAGYDANEKKRDPDAYDKLEACCKIDG